jgi:hypothetical protein
LSEAAMHKIIAARQADTPVEAPATAFLKMNCSNVSKTPEQSQRDDHNYGDYIEISELLSNGLLHFTTS